jgi:hypothetical protein
MPIPPPVGISTRQFALMVHHSFGGDKPESYSKFA